MSITIEQNTLNESYDLNSLEKLEAIDFDSEIVDLKTKNISVIETDNDIFVVEVDDEVIFYIETREKAQEFVDKFNDAVVDDTQQQVDLLQLQMSIENNPMLTRNILEETEFEAKLGTNFEVVAQKLDDAMKTYLIGIFGQEFYDNNQVVLDRMFLAFGSGIQFAMIETMASWDADDNQQFFDGFGNLDFGSAGSSFMGLFKTFSKGNEFVTLAQKVEKYFQLLNLHKNELINSQNPMFFNPYFVQQTLVNYDWQDEDELSTINLADIAIDIDGVERNLDPDEGSVKDMDLTPDQKAKLQLMADDETVLDNLTPDFINSLANGKVLDNAMKFLTKRGDFQGKATEIYGVVEGIFDMQIPVLSAFGMSMKDVIGHDSIESFFADDKHEGLKKVVNFLLSIFGFPNGIEGLQKSYYNEKLQKLVRNSNFVKNGLTAYQDAFVGGDLDISDANSALKLLGLSGEFSRTDEQIGNTVPQDLSKMNEILKNNLEDEMIVSPDLLGVKGIKKYLKNNKNEGVVRIKEGKQAEFAQAYLSYGIPEMLLQTDLIDSIAGDSDPKASFMTTLLGTIQAGTLFWKAKKLEIWGVDEFGYDVSKKTSTRNTDIFDDVVDNQQWLTVVDIIKTKKLSELTGEEIKQFAYLVWGTGPGTDLLLTLDGGTGAFVQRFSAIARNEKNLGFGQGNYALVEKKDTNGNVIRDANGNAVLERSTTAYDIGTFQIHGSSEDAAKNRYNELITNALNSTQYNGSFSVANISDLSASQSDLLSGIGHAMGRVSSFPNLLSDLADPSISGSNLEQLIVNTQGCTAAGGTNVVNYIDKPVEEYLSLSNFVDELDDGLLAVV